jgi:hypothetical protein
MSETDSNLLTTGLNFELQADVQAKLKISKIDELPPGPS